MNLSVVIPAYNVSKTLNRAIDSVLQQSIQPTEIIVIDDGSTDDTARITQEYGAAVRYFYQENAGLAVVRNVGIQKAKADWIAFLDADDEWLPNLIASHMEVLSRHPDVKWSHCNSEHVKDGLFCPRSIEEETREEGLQVGAVDYFEGRAKGLIAGACGFVIHRSVFDIVGYFDPEMRSGQDLDMWDRIALRFPLVGCCPDVCWRYYLDNASSLSRSRRPRDMQLRSLCRNMLLATSISEDTAKIYHRHARKRAVSYLLRQATGEIQIKSDILKEANTMFPLSCWEKMLQTALKILPATISRMIVARLPIYR